MKQKIFIILVLALVVFPIRTFAADSSPQLEIDALVGKWLWAIAHEYVDGYANCYWPDAINEMYDARGQSSVVVGVAALRKRQQEWSDNLDFSTIDTRYPEPTRFLPGSGDICVYSYVLKQFKEIEIFYFQKRNGEYRIFRQVDLFYGG
jgi:hypothetical protein